MNRSILAAHHPIPLQPIHSPLLAEKEVDFSLLRLDLTNKLVSGNKWFKLKYNLAAAREQNFTTLLSFGGPFSNHLHALAAAGKHFQFKTIGIIRGEENLPLNPTLTDLTAMGMQIHYINRIKYRQKHSQPVIDELRQKLGHFYLLPEGGTNDLAIQGTAEIAALITAKYDYLCVPCGTGGTIAGIINGCRKDAKVLGFPALKQAEYLQEQIQSLLVKKSDQHWELVYGYDFGGFAKVNRELALFMQQFEKQFSIPLDPIYTVKMLYGIFDLLKKGYFPRGAKIIAVHTGGLQGRRGMMAKINHLIRQ